MTVSPSISIERIAIYCNHVWYGIYVMTNLNVVLTNSPQHNVSYENKYQLTFHFAHILHLFVFCDLSSLYNLQEKNTRK